MTKASDLQGAVFGRLHVLRRADNTAHGKTTWLCKCACGNDCVIVAGDLKNGTTRSCGCIQRECAALRGRSSATHRLSNSREYRTWRAMHSRCSNPKASGYHNYGGRGVKVCNQWSRFDNFLADMGPRPEGRSLDRIDNEGHYEPSNCRWATPAEQTANRRKK